MAPHILVVLSNARDGRDDEFNRWYDDTHLGEVLKVEGFVAARRFRLSDSQMMEGCPYRYLAIYEVETEDLARSIEALGSGVGQMVISETLDTEGTAAWAFSPITDRVTR